MELHSQLKGLAEKVDQLKDKIDTEESTKHAFTLPFINILGYDTFNPTEVVPEFTADLGLKKGEKVDYAIFQNGIPILIVECKHWKQNLDVHNSQLFIFPRYENPLRTFNQRNSIQILHGFGRNQQNGRKTILGI